MFFRSGAPVQKGTPIFLFSAVTLEKFAKLSISASNPLHMQGRNYGGDPVEIPVTPNFWGTIAIIISIRGAFFTTKKISWLRPWYISCYLPPLPFFYCKVHQNHTLWSKYPKDCPKIVRHFSFKITRNAKLVPKYVCTTSFDHIQQRNYFLFIMFLCVYRVTNMYRNDFRRLLWGHGLIQKNFFLPKKIP